MKQSLSATVNETAVEPAYKTWSDARFEYTGDNSLLVKGTVTGNRYFFAQPGTVLVIDYRDTSAMRAEPMLKKINETA
ncbi:MAG: hypothetical protein K2X48_17590 [Chitinophagaceae bacterium]|nr:hypothetical protein [Chitinophagaceae bacterium]